MGSFISILTQDPPLLNTRKKTLAPALFFFNFGATLGYGMNPVSTRTLNNPEFNPHTIA